MRTVESSVAIPRPRQDEYKPQVDFYTQAMLDVIDRSEGPDLSEDELVLITFIGRQGVLSDALEDTFDPAKKQVIFEKQSALRVDNPDLYEQSASIRRALSSL